MSKKWDKRYIELAEFISKWSKDPSTQVASIIVDSQNRVVSMGYNGFARGVVDLNERYEDRDIKYKMVLHSEINAILFAQKNLTGCTIYTNLPPCTQCAAAIIQSGIKRIVTVEPSTELAQRWSKDFSLAKEMYFEAGIKLQFICRKI